MNERPFSFKRELLSILPAARAFAMSLSHDADRADDLLQEAVTRAWANQDKFQPGTNMKAWLFTILRNEFYSQMRKAGRETHDNDGALTEGMAVHPEQYGQMDLQDFKRSLDKLPADQREAIVLVGASGFSYEEAAEICGCAVGTIKSRVNRARHRLQELLGIDTEGEFGPDETSAPLVERAFATNSRGNGGK